MHIVVGFTDGAGGYLKEVLESVFRRTFPRHRFTFVKDPARTPHLLIYSVFGQRHRKYTCPRILVSGEPTNLAKSPYDLLIDCKNIARARRSKVAFCYFPFFASSFCYRYQSKPQDLLTKPKHEKPLFCAFLYRQNVSHRNRLYDIINSYKHVHALGSAKNPQPKQHFDRTHWQPGHSTFLDRAVQKFKPYKFVICCENTVLPGYITEKIINAMLAGSIPIYYGASDAVRIFNPKSFIYIKPGTPPQTIVETIRQIDQDDIKYAAMLQEPWFRNNQLPKQFFNNNDILVPYVRQIVTNKVLPKPKPRARAVPRRPMRRPVRTRRAAMKPTAVRRYKKYHRLRVLRKRAHA